MSSEHVELHYLTCHRDFNFFMTSLQSFIFWNDVNWKIVVHSDGSLTNDEVKIIQDTFNGRVIERDEADAKVLDALKDYPLCYKWRKDFLNKSRLKYIFLKIFDPMVFCDDYFVLFDSDVFFYDKDEFIIPYAENKIPFFHGGGFGSLKYPIYLQELISMGFNPVGNLNSGIIGMRKEMFDLDLIEKYFEAIEQNPVPYGEGKLYTGEEEPLFSCLIGRSPETKIIWAGDFDKRITPHYCYTKSKKKYGLCVNPLLYSSYICIHCAGSSHSHLNLASKIAKLQMDKHSM